LGKDFRATTPVICLENGRQGESIRVSSLDRKRIMVGEIVGPGLLRGDL
jgi:flagella basal body P-ring formation protein FlgA